jgi:hypothetical protein
MEKNMEEENVVLSANEQKKPEVKLVDVPVTDENVALNLIVAFVSLAQRRGVFSLDESAKIWECVKKFQKTA